MSLMFVKFKHANLKFTVYGRKQASIHTLSVNAITLVWGSLRLAPTSGKTAAGEHYPVYNNTMTHANSGYSGSGVVKTLTISSHKGNSIMHGYFWYTLQEDQLCVISAVHCAEKVVSSSTCMQPGSALAERVGLGEVVGSPII